MKTYSVARIGKACRTCNTLASIWRSRETTTTTIFNSVLLYGSETWAMTEKTVSKLQRFVNRCLRRILGISDWPATINNASLWETTGQAPMRQEIISTKWTWIGHTLRRLNYCIARQASSLESTGK